MYRDTRFDLSRLKSLQIFPQERNVDQVYVITRHWDECGLMDVSSAHPGREQEPLAANVPKVPVPLACYWLSE